VPVYLLVGGGGGAFIATAAAATLLLLLLLMTLRLVGWDRLPPSLLVFPFLSSHRPSSLHNTPTSHRRTTRIYHHCLPLNLDTASPSKQTQKMASSKTSSSSLPLLLLIAALATSYQFPPSLSTNAPSKNG